MNYSDQKKPATEINIFELFWDLLSQWKAILVVAIITSMLTAGFRYYQEIKSYNDSRESKKKAEEMAKVPKEEQINQVLENFSPDDVAAIEFVVQQKEWVAAERDYYSNSILLQTNPTNQRTLLLDYYLDSQGNDGSVSATLAYSYMGFLTSERIVDGLRKIIDPSSENKYIAELIIPPNKGEYVPGADDGDVVIQAKVVLPEDTDAAAVEKLITDELEKYSEELTKSIGPHVISLLRTSEARLYNTDAVNNRNSIVAHIFNIQNTYLKNTESNLSEKQRAAVNAIMAIKNSTESKTEIVAIEETDGRPTLRIKNLLLGFILGVALYAGLYLIRIVLKGRVLTPQMASSYSDSRLLGEIYYSGEISGINCLFHSNYVNKIRYRKKIDSDTQTRKASSAISSVCKHADTTDLTVIDMAGRTQECNRIVNEILVSLQDDGISLNHIDAVSGIDEKMLLQVKNAVLLIDSDTKMADLWNATQLCNSYDVRRLGSVYTRRI